MSRRDQLALPFSIAVFHRRLDNRLMHLSTLGLPFRLELAGKSELKVQRKLIDQIRDRMPKLTPAELTRFKLTPGIALEQPHLEISVKTATGRVRAGGRFPLVIEPRTTARDHEIAIAYHPLRDSEWFAVDPDQPLAGQAAQFFRARWSKLSPDEVEALKSTGKESLRALSFSARVRSLIDLLEARKTDRKRPPTRPPRPVLPAIGSDETRRAIDGTLAGGRPREPYRTQIDLALSGARATPAIVVGPPGAGKSTILRRWVHDLLERDGYELDRNADRIRHVWRVSGQRLIAGMIYLGDWEQRCLALFEEAARQRAVLWIEDLHLFGRLGQTRQSDRQLAEVFRGPIARGELTCVGECTPEQLSRLEDDAPSFAQLFSRVTVAPTAPIETLEMMVHEARELERARRLAFHPFTFRTVVEVGGALQPWKVMPGKALDLVRALADRAARWREPSFTGRTEITPQDVISLLSAQTGLAENMLTLDARLDPDDVAARLGRRVIGQPAAIGAACDAVFRIRAGLCDPKRPFAVYLFTGPTGTGKTELAKTLAEFLFGDPARLLRFDMSEYAGPDAVARLIGDRWAPEGLLTRRVRDQPFAVVLLDEIEKAHRSVINLLLQLLDEGRLTDAAGDTASFQHTVIVMTSNLGARSSLPIGFGDSTDAVMTEVDRAVREFFPPELFNRIDRVVPFSPLGPGAAEQIAGKELAKLFGRRGLIDRHIFVQPTRSVQRAIVDQAFDVRYGARTVKRWLEDHVGGLLTGMVSRAPGQAMRLVRLYRAGGAFKLHAEALTEASPLGEPLALEPLIDLPAVRLRPHASAAAERVAALAARLDFDPLAAAADTTGARYWLDLFRHELDDLSRALEGDGGADAAHRDELLPRIEPSGPRRGRVRATEPRSAGAPAEHRDALEAIARAHLFERCAAAVADPEQHELWLELLRVGRDDFADTARRELLEWMIAAYAATGMVEETVRAPGGAAHVLLRVSGLFARAQLETEQGCHIWRSPSEEPQIVRVRLLPATAERRGSAVFAAHREAARAFESALEAGVDPLPDNPERLLPAVRTLAFSPALRPGDVFPVDVEEFALGHVATVHAVTPLAVFRRLRLLAMSRSAPTSRAV